MKIQERGATHVSTAKIALAAFALALILISDFAPQFQPRIIPLVHAQGGSGVVTLSPANNWGPFVNTAGDVQINLNKSGIAVRVEIPREFIDANVRFPPVIFQENDTHFIESDIRNDYYYYSVIDESLHWSYAWKGAQNSAPCFKPKFAFYAPNAPWCVEIWNFLNETFHNFTAPKFVRFHGLNAPPVAGVYNFTVFIADHLNTTLGYPDFVNAWNESISVPVSMKPHPGSINGTMYDCFTEEPIKAKGIVYALSDTGAIVARTFVNPANGSFSLTGLARDQTYTIQGSAGPFRENDGIVRSFSLTTKTEHPCSGAVASVGIQSGFALYLKRSPRIIGVINYYDSTSPIKTQINAIAGHPWLTKIDSNLQVLNVTVEAKDLATQISYWNRTISHNSTYDPSTDKFQVLTGQGVGYVGTRPYGTEFAGLPQTGTLRIHVWVTGYTIDEERDVILAPDTEQNITLSMNSAGVIKLNIQFVDPSQKLETPHSAEVNSGIVPTTDTIFGGNLVIRAVDSAGLLNATTYVNGTFPNGVTRYFDQTSVTYYVIGFSEYYNRTWSSLLKEPDSGLLNLEYSLSVFVRGYEQLETTEQSKARPSCASPSPGPCTIDTKTLNMKRGGAFLVTVSSFNNRFGSRVPQAPQPWRFLNLSIPVRARVYFSGPFGSVGYVERLMITHIPISHIPNGVNLTSFKVVFAGQNWSLRDLWFLGQLPTWITDATYTIRAFTLGYVRYKDTTVQASLGIPQTAYVTLLIGNGIGLIGCLLSAPAPCGGKGNAVFLTIPEHDHIIADAFNGGARAGALPGNLTAGLGTLRLPIFGFGAMVINTTFTGLGHFFYEPLDGSGCTNYGFYQDFNHCFDYGLDVGNYTAQIPEFGFNKHFMQLPSPISISFSDLGYAPDPGVSLIAMGKITQGIGPTGPNYVTGEVPDEAPVALSWIRAEATNGTYIGACSSSLTGTIDRCVPTLDGLYDGVGALFLPAAANGSAITYNVTLTDLANFCSPASGLVPVAWNSESFFYGNGPLNCLDPPPQSPPQTNLTQPPANLNPDAASANQRPQAQRILNVTTRDEDHIL